MADLQPLTCPNCGAALNAASDQAEIKCGYCGTTVLVPHSTPAPATQIVIPIDVSGPIGTGRSSAATWIVPIAIVAVVLAFVGFIISSVMNQVNQVSDAALAPLAEVLTSVPSVKNQRLATKAPEATETPTPSLTPAPTPLTYSKIVLRDDFSDPQSGWDRTTANGNSMNYADGGYLISIGSANSGETSWIKDGLKDVSVEVDEETQSGGGWVGVMCRVKQDVGGYSFEISSDGDYGIYRYIFSPNGSTSKELTYGYMGSDQFNVNGSNHLRGDCIGKTFTLVVNGQVIAQATDGSFGTGGAGLLAVAFSDSDNGLDALFKNFAVKSP